jgi:hypothetical protein
MLAIVLLPEAVWHRRTHIAAVAAAVTAAAVAAAAVAAAARADSCKDRPSLTASTACCFTGDAFCCAVALRS